MQLADSFSRKAGERARYTRHLMILTMLKRLRENFMRREHLLWLGLAAVFVPMLLLLWLQYRALLDLRAKTRVVIEYNLRQSLQQLNRDAETRLVAYARATLAQLDSESLLAWRLDEMRQRFAAVRQAHPEINQVYGFTEMTADAMEHTAVWDGQTWRALTENGDADEAPASSSNSPVNSPEAVWKAALDFSLAAQPPEGQQVEFLFGRTDDPKAPAALYLFRVVKVEGEKACVVGVSWRPDYVRDAVLQPLFAAGLQAAGEDARAAGLTLAALQSDQQPFYATNAETKQFEISVPFAPAFPGWQLAAAYRRNGIAELAQRYHRQSLWLNGLALLALLGGAALVGWVFHRELRLAREKSAFVSNVSHELKTPLALIRLFAETLLLGRVRNAEKAAEYHRIIVNETDRLTQLINNILDFSAIEAGRKEYQFAPCDLADIVREVLHSYEFVMQKAGFAVETSLAENLPPVKADRDALAQALLNLLNNAVKYSRDERRIKVALAQSDGGLALSVTDRGIGIQRGEQKRIFEKFYRAGNPLVHETKGTGLGLSLVQHIVHAHGGTITVESTPEEGSCFTIRLPLWEA